MSVAGIVFELVSAYGTVGLSLGAPYVRMIRTTYSTGHPLIIVGELLTLGGFAPSFEDRRVRCDAPRPTPRASPCTRSCCPAPP